MIVQISRSYIVAWMMCHLLWVQWTRSSNTVLLNRVNGSPQGERKLFWGERSWRGEWKGWMKHCRGERSWRGEWKGWTNRKGWMAEIHIYPSAQSKCCRIKYRNKCLVPSKLHAPLRKQHSNHQNRSKKFFINTCDYLLNQQNSSNSMVKKGSLTIKLLLIASLQISHVLMQ